MVSRAVLDAFISEHGRGPTLLEVTALREAEASVSLDKGDGGTYSLPEGAYTMTPSQVEAAKAKAKVEHLFCGRLDCAAHKERATREHELRIEGMRLAIELINEHRHGFGSMHPADEFIEGLECAENVINLATVDPLFVPPNYDELSDPTTLLHSDEATAGGDGER